MGDLDSYRVYHFHDTSDSAAVKTTCDVQDNRFLRPQADNLAAFLYWLQEKKPDHFHNIVDTVRQVAPFFDSFILAPSKLNESKIMLEWREKGSDAYFNAASFSDGTLRFICLATLLLQPQYPAVILLDEPEIGLHPAAITLLAALISSAATRTQVIVSTQSVTLVNQFDPIMFGPSSANTAKAYSKTQPFRYERLLDDYGLGELWEKNNRCAIHEQKGFWCLLKDRRKSVSSRMSLGQIRDRKSIFSRQFLVTKRVKDGPNFKGWRNKLLQNSIMIFEGC